MNINEAIKLAVEKGGYVIPQLKANPNTTNEGIDLVISYLNKASITQDPLFWQALGKTLGWSKSFTRDWGEETNEGIEDERYEQGIPEYEFHAHEYFDLLLTGGDTEKWWKELLKQ